jgi:hypothetical protein
LAKQAKHLDNWRNIGATLAKQAKHGAKNSLFFSKVFKKQIMEG